MEKNISKEIIYHGKILDLELRNVKLPNNQITKREIVIHKPGVSIVATDNEYIYLVKQYRSAIEQEIIEIPAGLSEDNEDPQTTAARELQEEIGYGAKNFKLLTKFYPSPGFSNEITYIFLATKLFKSKLPEDSDEFIEVYKLPVSKVKSFLKENKTIDAKTALGLSLFLLEIN